MSKSAKEIALVAVYVALLLGGQYALSSIPNVEVVTLLIACFGFYFGIVRGVTVVTLFSLLRCFIFGFFPTAIVLYLVYFNFLSVVFSLLGIAFKKSVNLWKMVIIVVVVCATTCLFTLLDDVITPLFFGFAPHEYKIYFYASLPYMLTQVISAFVSVSLLFCPVIGAFSYVNLN